MYRLSCSLLVSQKANPPVSYVLLSHLQSSTDFSGLRHERTVLEVAWENCSTSRLLHEQLGLSEEVGKSVSRTQHEIRKSTIGERMSRQVSNAKFVQCHVSVLSESVGIEEWTQSYCW